MSEELIPKVKQMIIESLRIEGMSPDEIETDAPLFGDGLGLDSIDALQLVVAMEKELAWWFPMPPPAPRCSPRCAAWPPISLKTGSSVRLPR